MAQVNSLTVNDGADTPAALAFAVQDRDGTRSRFRTSSAALVQGQKEIAHSANIGVKKNSANTVRLTFLFPVEATVDGITKVDSTSTATVQINYAQSLTHAQRQAFYGLIVNALSNADVKAQNIDVAPLS